MKSLETHSLFDSPPVHPGLVSHRFTRVLGTQIFHDEMGSGKPLVLVHGLNDSHRSWHRIMPLLARSRRVLALDLAGCGLSGRPDASYTLEWHADVVHAWLDALGIGECDVVGHSYGGGVAQYMLLRQPCRIRRLALVAAGGLGREVSFELRLASLPMVVERFGQPFMALAAGPALRAVGGVVDREGEQWMRKVNSFPGTARAFSRTVRDVIDWRGQRRHFRDRAREIDQFPPVALLWGDKDRVIPHAHAIASMELMRGATLTTFPGCGHFPHHQCPQEVARALTGFFDAPRAQPVSFAMVESSGVAA
jgi:pimeloyl-ACP methyl ester carboxylesterase